MANSILIVEDRFVKESGLAEKLSAEGYRVNTVSGPSALAEAEKAPPDLIITDTDLKNPGQDTGLLEAFKKSDKTKNSAIFVLTESMDIPLEVKLRKLKLDYFFTKTEEVTGQLVKEAKRFFTGQHQEETVDMSFIKDNEKYARDEFDRFKDPFEDLEVEMGETAEFTEVETIQADFKLGERLLDEGKYDEALKKLSEVEAFPKYQAQAALLKGICYKKLGKLKEAVKTLQAGAKLCGNLEEKAGYYYEIGTALQDAGKFREALRFLEAAYKIDPKYGDVAKRLKEVKTKL